MLKTLRKLVCSEGWRSGVKIIAQAFSIKVTGVMRLIAGENEAMKFPRFERLNLDVN